VFSLVFPDRLRSIDVDENYRMRIDLLTAAIDADKQAGLTPFMVVGNAGTTNTGAVDPLEQLAELCAREKLWFHIDGAYGAFFHMVEELRPVLRYEIS
jgi:aromatic-L-amino-acid decarboxylase